MGRRIDRAPQGDKRGTSSLQATCTTARTMKEVIDMRKKTKPKKPGKPGC